MSQFVKLGVPARSDGSKKVRSPCLNLLWLCLKGCKSLGWEYPIYAVSDATNGHMNAEFNEGKLRILRTHGEELLLPIHIMFVDSSGRFKPELFSWLPFKDTTIQ